MIETTVDKLLGGRFEVEQPKKGYRIAVDTLLLASAVPASAGQKVLELGCGVGGVMLALASRVGGVCITGLDIQPEMVALCESNIRRNSFEERLRAAVVDIVHMPAEHCSIYDHVMINPPYHDHKTHTVSAQLSKRIAHAESDEVDLGVWIDRAFLCLKDGGMLTLIHRADRLEEIAGMLQKHALQTLIKPIIARDSVPAKRVIIRALKGEPPSEPQTMLPFILYGSENRYSEAADAVLRQAAFLSFS